MIVKKELLSENLTAYMDYAMEVMNSLDGAPEHTPEQVALVNEKIENLKVYLQHLQTSYRETVPAAASTGGLTDIVL